MQQQAERFGAKTKYAEVLKLELEGEEKTVITNEGEYLAKSVVISTGANPRPLGVAGDDRKRRWLLRPLRRRLLSGQDRGGGRRR